MNIKYIFKLINIKFKLLFNKIKIKLNTFCLREIFIPFVLFYQFKIIIK